jgi:hypothetical protein
VRYELRLAHLSDGDILRRLASLLRDSRRVEADLVAHIGEVEQRRLYAREASPSMFAYCTEVLHLSEAEAYLRISAGRAAREHPLILEMLEDGRLHLSGIGKLVPHLTRENAATLLARAAHRSKRQIEELIAEIAPRPDVPTLVRKLPGTAIGPEDSRPTASRPTASRPGSRYIPAALRRAVYVRDLLASLVTDRIEKRFRVTSGSELGRPAEFTGPTTPADSGRAQVSPWPRSP